MTNQASQSQTKHIDFLFFLQIIINMENIIIIWGGPAGHTAGIYTARDLLQPLLFEWMMAWDLPPWWQLTLTSWVENFPGFPDEISGFELMQNIKKQDIKFWTRIITKTIDKVDFSSSPFRLRSGDQEFQTKSVIIATWAVAKRLNLPWENKFWQRWISACATCDGWLPIYRDQRLVVIWWWEVAWNEALHLTKFANEVIILVRKPQMKASPLTQKKLNENHKIKILYNTEATECFWDKFLEWIKIIWNLPQSSEILPCKWLFYAIWHRPNTELFAWQLDIDDNWFIKTDKQSWQTSIPWIFAAGDVQDPTYRQAITAAASWAIAGINTSKYVENLL